MNALLSIWAWVAILLAATSSFLVQLLLVPLTLPFDRGRKAVGRTYRLAAVASAKLSPFWRFRIHGPLPKPRPRRTIVVSNHESNADPFLISHLPWEMKWLAKRELFKVPIIGWACWLAGDIPVSRGVAQSGRDALARCAWWLDRGVPVMIFPEGTRSPNEDLLPFRDGAFRLALESGAEILPIAISGTRRALPKHSWRFAQARALVTVGQPISTRGMTLADLERLKEQARAQIVAMREELQRVIARS